MSRRSKTATILVAAVLLPVAAADAASVKLDRPCYSRTPEKGQPMILSGSGFDPSSSVTVSGQISGSTATDKNGAFKARLTAPKTETEGPDPSSIVTYSLTVTSAKDPAKTANVEFKVANLAAQIDGTAAALTDKLTFTFSGFPAGKTIWGHYVFRGKEAIAVPFGRAAAPCGTLSVAKPQLPANSKTKGKAGDWTVQWDPFKPYKANSTPRLRSTFKTSQTSSLK